MIPTDEQVERGCVAACHHPEGDNTAEGSSLLTPNAIRAWKPFVTAILTAALGDVVVVPREPTMAMLAAGQTAWLDDPQKRSSTLYRAMVEAAALPRAERGAGS